MITIQVHQKDVFDELVRNKLKDPRSFKWQQPRGVPPLAIQPTAFQFSNAVGEESSYRTWFDQILSYMYDRSSSIASVFAFQLLPSLFEDVQKIHQLF